MDFPDETVVALPKSKIPDAAGLLSRAFWNDPMTVFLYPDVVERGDLHPQFFILSMEHAFIGGELYTTSAFKGIAVWRFFGDETRPTVDAANDPRNKLPEAMGDVSFQRLMIIAECTNEMHGQLVKEQHCYLFFLGVEPGHQGNGIGSILMQPVLKRADEKGLPCYLETMEEKNLTFYNRHGFKVVGEKQVPHGGPYIWALLRLPGK